MIASGLASSRERARALIMSGSVHVNGQVADKPGALIHPASRIELQAEPIPYVSRGGIKLAGALLHFGLDVRGWVCVDVGASTGVDACKDRLERIDSRDVHQSLA